MVAQAERVQGSRQHQSWGSGPTPGAPETEANFVHLAVLNCLKLAPQRVRSELFPQRRRLEPGESDGLNKDYVRVDAKDALYGELIATWPVSALLPKNRGSKESGSLTATGSSPSSAMMSA